MKPKSAVVATSSPATGARTSKPALLVLTSTYPRWAGDPEPGFVHELAKRLTDDFHVIVLGPSAPGTRAREIADGVEVVRYRYAPFHWETLVNNGGIVTNLKRNKWKFLLVPTFVLAQVWSAWRLVRTRNIQVIHAHWLIPQGLTAALLQWLPGPEVRFMVTSHGADLFALRGVVLQRIKRHVIRRASAISVVSEAMRKRLRQIDNVADAVRVLPMGVDLRSRFAPAPDIERSNNELLFVGRLVEKKGLRHLLDAMPAVLAARPDARLVIAGFGPEEGALKDQVSVLGIGRSVKFLGAVSQADLPDLYRRAAVFVAPFVEADSGDQEGLGLVVVEALGCGCPIVVGDVPAVRDVFDGASHRVINPRNTPELVAAILDILVHRGASLDEAERLRQILLKKFDWESVADAYARVLASSIRGRS